MAILIIPNEGRVSHFINDKGERVPSHRYREIRDGINVKPTQDLKDDPEVIRILNALDILERKSRPSLGADAKGKGMAASDAIAFAGELVDYVAGWAIDHQRGLAQRTLGERELRKEQFKSPIKPTFEPRYPTPEPLDEDHRDEKEGAFRGQLDPVQTRRFLFNILRPMSPLLVPRDVIEAIEALDFGETLPIFQRAYTSKRTGLIEYRAKLRALAFIEYESAKGTRKRISVEKVADAFAVTEDSVKDWRVDLRVALGNFEVAQVLEGARDAGKSYILWFKKIEDMPEDAHGICEFLEGAHGKPALLREAKRYKARSKKALRRAPKIRG